MAIIVNNNILEMLLGEFIKLTLKRSLKQTVEIRGTYKTIESPFKVYGYLIDIDDEYYYLGLEPNQLHKCVPKTSVDMLELADPDEKNIEFMEDIVETPNNPNGIN